MVPSTRGIIQMLTRSTVCLYLCCASKRGQVTKSRVPNRCLNAYICVQVSVREREGIPFVSACDSSICYLVSVKAASEYAALKS